MSLRESPTRKRLLPTTLCRRALLLLALATPASAASAPEAALVLRFLEGPVGQSALRAAAAEARAEGTAPPLLPNPELEARHEEARGVAGSTTDALGGAMTFDLGFSSFSERGAARLRRRAGDHWRYTAGLAAVSDLRSEALDLWAADAAAEATGRSQQRHEALLVALTALAEAGEASDYDRDRVALAITPHRVVAAEARGKRDTLRARLSALVGAATPVEAVDLQPIPPLPTLDAARERALTEHPELAALRLDHKADVRALTAARQSAIPDLTLSAAARWDAPPEGGSATQGFEVGGALEVPLFDWSRVSVRAATAERATGEALLAEREAEIAAAVDSAWQRASSLTDGTPPIDPEAIWEASHARYAAGEATVEDLLQIADDVEAASLAVVDHERLLRQAHLDLASAVGQFFDSEIQSLLEEHLR